MFADICLYWGGCFAYRSVFYPWHENVRIVAERCLYNVISVYSVSLIILWRGEVREEDEKYGDYRRKQKHLLEQGPKGFTDRAVAWGVFGGADTLWIVFTPTRACKVVSWSTSKTHDNWAMGVVSTFFFWGGGHILGLWWLKYYGS